MTVSFYLARPTSKVNGGTLEIKIDTVITEIRDLLYPPGHVVIDGLPAKKKIIDGIAAKVESYRKGLSDTKPTVIFARVCYEGLQLKYYLPESIIPIHWNYETHRAKESKKFPEYPEFNTRLNSIENTIKTVIRRYTNDNNGLVPSPAKLKGLLDIAIRQRGKVEKMTFMRFFADYITRAENGTRLTNTGKPIKDGTIKNYKSTKNCIENYEKHAKKKIDFEHIDMQFYNDFTRYLTLTIQQSTNYIGKHIKTIKAVLNDAIEHKLTTNTDFQKKSFKAVNESADNVYLPEWELKQLAKLDLAATPRLDRVRDLFIVGCYTGLRFSDLSTLTNDQIEGDYITITQIKTGDPVVIPVHNMVREILGKYNGMLPAAPSNQKTNEYIKEVAKMDKAPAFKKRVAIKFTKGGVQQNETYFKWELITTHTARRSFATNEYIAGTPALTIMAITGHKTEAAFLRYIKVTPAEHAKIMKASWEKRESSNSIAI